MISNNWLVRFCAAWFVGGSFLLAGSLSHACSCMAFPEDVSEATRIAYERADAVFVGDVVSINNADDGNYLEATVNVRRAWKGVAAGASIIVRTSRSSATCGYPFRQAPYLLFAYDAGDAGVYLSGLCDLNLSEKAAAGHIGALDALASAAPGSVVPEPPIRQQPKRNRDKCSKRGSTPP